MLGKRVVDGADAADVLLGVEAAFDLEDAEALSRAVACHLDSFLHGSQADRDRRLDAVAVTAQQAIERLSGRQTQQVVEGDVEGAQG